MVPECEHLPPVFRLDYEYPRAEFETRIVADRHEPWLILGHCVICGQGWLVEEQDAHSRSPNFAVKIENPLRWSPGEERALESLTCGSAGEVMRPPGSVLWRAARVAR